ncbi:MAG: hypothetical protein MZV70_09615 [Desulfobacterales bacterium]|nr:hypothetical protein [Desulfobacterales bacterium]
MRASGLFRAVFSRYETEEGRFVISGGIEEFYLRMDKSNKTALISISISLQDTREKETGKRMMFQKKYVREEPLQESVAPGILPGRKPGHASYLPCRSSAIFTRPSKPPLNKQRVTP